MLYNSPAGFVVFRVNQGLVLFKSRCVWPQYPSQDNFVSLAGSKYLPYLGSPLTPVLLPCLVLQPSSACSFLGPKGLVGGRAYPMVATPPDVRLDLPPMSGSHCTSRLLRLLASVLSSRV